MVSFDSGVLAVRPDIIVMGDWRGLLDEVSDDDESSEGWFSTHIHSFIKLSMSSTSSTSPFKV